MIWRERPIEQTEVSKLADELGVHLALSRMLLARGLKDANQARQFFTQSFSDLLDPMTLSNIVQCNERIERAILNKEKVLVHGDFDADGVTSCALLTLFLKHLGLEVYSFIPNRLEEGHGLSLNALTLAKKHGVSLVITCDCASSDVLAMERYNQEGVDLIVTDHHESDPNLNRPCILVNPRAYQDIGHDDLAGCGVVFLLMVALRSHLRERGFFKHHPEPNLKSFLDIVALGTIADMAPLMGQNRLLVQKGLGELSKSSRHGLRALFDVQNLMGEVSAQDVGFLLAPLINASCRLGHAQDALNLLLCQDPLLARNLALKLKSHNLERKKIFEKMVQKAHFLAQIDLQNKRSCIVVFDESFHIGINGLVAQHLSQTFNLPAFVFTKHQGQIKGSARSAKEANIHEALLMCKDSLLGFGGHVQAGGCTVKSEAFPQFKEQINQAFEMQKLSSDVVLWTDGELDLFDVSMPLLSVLDKCSPFGVKNPEPVFVSKAHVANAFEVGQNHLKLVLKDHQNNQFDGIAFKKFRSHRDVSKGQVLLAYTPEKNTYMSKSKIQLRIQDIKQL